MGMPPKLENSQPTRAQPIKEFLGRKESVRELDLAAIFAVGVLPVVLGDEAGMPDKMDRQGWDAEMPSGSGFYLPQKNDKALLKLPCYLLEYE